MCWHRSKGKTMISKKCSVRGKAGKSSEVGMGLKRHNDLLVNSLTLK